MSNPFLGEIRMFAGNYEPDGWSFCDGRLLQISSNSALFSLLGTTYGGNGETNFALPDLRGRVPMHEGNGPGLTPRNLGQRSGAETATVSTSQLPAHRHDLLASTEPADPAADPVGDRVGDGGDIRFYSAVESGDDAPMSALAVGSTGGGQTHANMAPFLAVQFIIARAGTFPSPS